MNSRHDPAPRRREPRARVSNMRPDLDALDLSIARELKLDARQSSRKLGAQLGVSGTAIAKRLRRLVDADVLSFCCLTDPAFLGFQVNVLLCLKTTPGKEDNVARAIQRYGCVQNVSLVAGRYDVLVFAVFRDHRRQLQWMTSELGAIEDIVDYDECHQLQMIKNSWGYTDSRHAPSAATVLPRLSESELKLIRALETNPRENIDSLARQVGLSRKTVARSLQRLLDEDIVRIISITDPIAMGYTLHALIFLKVRLDSLSSIADQLAAHERTTHVIILGGNHNMLVAAAFRALDEMSRFLRTELGGMAGVIDRETMIHIARPKWSFRGVAALDQQ